jgi:hypothetical protein
MSKQQYVARGPPGGYRIWDNRGADVRARSGALRLGHLPAFGREMPQNASLPGNPCLTLH